MTPEELNDRPNGWPSMPARDQFLINAVGRELNDRDQRMAALEQRIEALEKKIDELEFRQGQFRYCGTWSAGQIYFEGNFVTDGGSLWHANRQTTQRPGDGSSDFSLCVKRGKDADTRRLPTMQRAQQ